MPRRFIYHLWLIIISVSSIAQHPAVVHSSFIFENAPFKSCHASTIVQTKEGLAAAWFGGTHEKNPDVEIYFSKKTKEKWTTPKAVANGIQHNKKRYPCWNPVLHQVPNGNLLLFYKVGPDPSHWWGELIRSNDDGNTWSAAQRLPEDILGPVKNKAILLENGRLLCPSSKETEVGDEELWQVFIEESNDQGKTWKISEPLNDGIEIQAIQPSILKYADGRLQLICRSREDKLVSIWSMNNGESWEKATHLNVPNPNSGTDAVSLKNGSQLLVYNPTQKIEGKWGGPRSPLSVALSVDGLDWQKVVDLETANGEYSYPAVIEDDKGLVHITYTHNRTKIKYVILDPKLF